MEYRDRTSGDLLTEQQVRESINALLPAVLGAAECDILNVDPILASPVPTPTSTQYVVRNGVVQDGLGNWVQAWSVVDKQASDISAALADAKVRKNLIINRWREEANETSFTFNGKHISTSMLSKLDILFMNGEILNQGGLTVDWIGKWKAIDNTYVDIPTLADWKAFYSACVNQGTSNFKHSEYLKGILRLPTTDSIEKVEAIVW